VNLTLNLHFARTRNIGDLCSLPMSYFDLPKPVQSWHVLSPLPNLPNVNLLFGGGGIDPHPCVERAIRSIAGHRGKKVLWGGGTHLNKGSFSSASLVELFDLAGIRDWVPEYKKASWVPCASCMSKLFDKRREVKHGVVVFEHENIPLGLAGIPRMTNFWKPNRGLRHVQYPKPKDVLDYFAECVEFLGSGETVISTSYHGTYWATLLGKKVVAVPAPQRDKFLLFKYPPVLSNRQGCLSARAGARAYPEALKDCRSANEAFSRRVIDFLVGQK
jgi:hypothetical protein